MNKQEVIDYLMYTPYNTNLAVLKSMLGDGDWDELLDYVKRTSHRMNRHVLEGILGADDYIVLVDGTYTFLEDEGVAVYSELLNAHYDSMNVTVIFDGATFVLPKYVAPVVTSKFYGEFTQEGMPIFTTYPIAVLLDQEQSSGVLVVAASTAGSHTVKVIVPSDSEIDGGGDMSEDAIVGEAIVGEAIVGEEIIDNGGLK